MEKRELAFGVYEATPELRAIEKHSCVCYKDDYGLVALTGPADDKESQEYAELFAATLDLLEAAKAAYIWLSNFQPHIPIWTSHSDLELREQLRAAITKAKGS